MLRHLFNSIFDSISLGLGIPGFHRPALSMKFGSEEFAVFSNTRCRISLSLMIALPLCNCSGPTIGKIYQEWSVIITNQRSVHKYIWTWIGITLDGINIFIVFYSEIRWTPPGQNWLHKRKHHWWNISSRWTDVSVSGTRGNDVVVVWHTLFTAQLTRI